MLSEKLQIYIFMSSIEQIANVKKKNNNLMANFFSWFHIFSLCFYFLSSKGNQVTLHASWKSLAQRREGSGVKKIYQHVKISNRWWDGARLFLVMPSDRTIGSRHKLKWRKFHLNVRKNFCTVRMVKPWTRSCGVFIFKDIKNPTGHSSEQHGDPALSTEGLD